MSAGTQTRYRARVGPRRGQGRTTRPGIHWDRVGRIVLVLVILVVLASYVRPALGLFDGWRESRAAEERLAELQAENKRLEKRAEELKTPTAAIRQARALGLVGAGEQAYKVEGLD